MTTEKTLHAFEKAGLGTAPFRCVGMMTVRPQDACEAARDTGLSVCCCNYCGTGIIHNFIIRGATGRHFVVGSDCVGRTGDAAGNSPPVTTAHVAGRGDHAAHCRFMGGPSGHSCTPVLCSRRIKRITTGMTSGKAEIIAAAPSSGWPALNASRKP